MHAAPDRSAEILAVPWGGQKVFVLGARAAANSFAVSGAYGEKASVTPLGSSADRGFAVRLVQSHPGDKQTDLGAANFDRNRRRRPASAHGRPQRSEVGTRWRPLNGSCSAGSGSAIGPGVARPGWFAGGAWAERTGAAAWVGGDAPPVPVACGCRRSGCRAIAARGPCNSRGGPSICKVAASHDQQNDNQRPEQPDARHSPASGPGRCPGPASASRAAEAKAANISWR